LRAPRNLRFPCWCFPDFWTFPLSCSSRGKASPRLRRYFSDSIFVATGQSRSTCLLRPDSLPLGVSATAGPVSHVRSSIGRQAGPPLGIFFSAPDDSSLRWMLAILSSAAALSSGCDVLFLVFVSTFSNSLRKSLLIHCLSLAFAPVPADSYESLSSSRVVFTFTYGVCCGWYYYAWSAADLRSARGARLPAVSQRFSFLFLVLWVSAWFWLSFIDFVVPNLV
jgi:hypothetical protein